MIRTLPLGTVNKGCLYGMDFKFKSRGMEKSVFDLKKIADNISHIKLNVKALCGDNAKPIILLYFNDGAFTATHS